MSKAFVSLNHEPHTETTTGVKGLGVFVCEGGGGRGGWSVRKRGRETPATKARVFCTSPLISIIPAVTSLSIRRALSCITDFTRECIANGGFVAVEHEKIFVTECRRRDSQKKL